MASISAGRGGGAGDSPPAKKVRSARSFFASVEANLAAPKIVSGIAEDGDSAEVVRIGTHSGTFHCDEALACAMLKTLDPYAGQAVSIVRTRDGETLDKCSIVVDVGGIYDAQKKRFDHHQRGFFESLKESDGLGSGTKLSSAGLVYRHYGRDVIRSILRSAGESVSDKDLEVLYKKMYLGFVEHVDGIDNGINAFTGERNYKVTTTLSDRVATLNPAWNEENTPEIANENFRNAMNLTLREFCDRLQWETKSTLVARTIVEKAVRGALAVESKKGKSYLIATLDQYCPWKGTLQEAEAEAARDETCEAVKEEGSLVYVLYPGAGETWRVQAVPLEGFTSRLPLPAPWRGLRDEELSKLSGIPGCVFVHNAGFIGGNKTYDGALAMAKKAIAEFA